MGEAKRMAEAEEQRRNRKITFIREKAPDFIMGVCISGRPVTKLDVLDAVASAGDLYEMIEEKARRISSGDEK